MLAVLAVAREKAAAGNCNPEVMGPGSSLRTSQRVCFLVQSEAHCWADSAPKSTPKTHQAFPASNAVTDDVRYVKCTVSSDILDGGASVEAVRGR